MPMNAPSLGMLPGRDEVYTLNQSIKWTGTSWLGDVSYRTDLVSDVIQAVTNCFHILTEMPTRRIRNMYIMTNCFYILTEMPTRRIPMYKP